MCTEQFDCTICSQLYEILNKVSYHSKERQCLTMSHLVDKLWFLLLCESLAGVLNFISNLVREHSTHPDGVGFTSWFRADP